MIDQALELAHIPERHREMVAREISRYATIEEMVREARRLRAVLQDTWNL